NWQSVLFATAGGVVLSIGNLATQYAWAFVGSSVAEVIPATLQENVSTAIKSSDENVFRR
ncbi:Uroporphyrinogen-III synthase, partial [Sarracenia purpurea var. burkii]